MENRMQVRIISEETIKPSSPTPIHLKNFKLSVIAQFAPIPYTKMVIFYENHTHSGSQEALTRSKMLKQSLSETLTRYYPLAGTIRDHLSIDCDDNGAYYARAQVNCHLSGFLNHLDIRLMNQFLPSDSGLYGPSGSRVVGVQVNMFECKGVAIGLCLSHKILDGVSIGAFLKDWSMTAHSCNPEAFVHPDLSSATSLIPTDDISRLKDSFMAALGSVTRRANRVTRRFIFDLASISALKEAAIRQNVDRPTSVVLVSALIWKSALAAFTKIHGCSRPSLVSHFVNLRTRASPNLSDKSVGNLSYFVSAECEAKQEFELKDLAGKLNKSISTNDSEFISSLRNGAAELHKFPTRLRDFSSEKSDFVMFTSRCKLGWYEADFGWGKPAWIGLTEGLGGGQEFRNRVALMDTRCGTGIEAWVSLDEQEMEILQRNPDFLAFASLDPSPLSIGNVMIN